MAQNYGLKGLHPSSDKHVFGQVTPLTGSAVHAQFQNDSAGVDIILQLLETGVIRLEDGAVGTPVLSARADVDTGVYFPAVAKLALAIAGVQALLVDATNITAKKALLAAAGSAALPGVAIDGDPDTGIFGVAANELGLAAAGAIVAKVLTNQFLVTGAQAGVAIYDAATTYAIDWVNGNHQKFALGATNVFTETGGVAGFGYTMFVKQDGTGSRTVTFPATFKGEDGAAVPQPDTTVNRTTIYVLIYDGTNYAVKDAGSFDL